MPEILFLLNYSALNTTLRKIVMALSHSFITVINKVNNKKRIYEVTVISEC